MQRISGRFGERAFAIAYATLVTKVSFTTFKTISITFVQRAQRFLLSVEQELQRDLKVNLKKAGISLKENDQEELVRLVSCRMIMEDSGSIPRFEGASL